MKEVVKITEYKSVDGRVFFCCLSSDGMQLRSGFGKTEDESKEDSFNNFNKKRK